MPFTPFHLGPALFFGLLFFSAIHLPTFLIANVIVDFEPFFVLVTGINYPLHGLFHTFLGGAITAIILALVMIRLDGKVQKIMRFFKLEQKHSQKTIWLAAFLGIYLHIFLDSFLYTDIKPLFPFSVNPFYNSTLSTGFEIYSLCVIAFVLGIAIYTYGILKR